MNIIISEKQNKLLQEVTVGKGILKSDPLAELFDELLNRPKVIKLTRKYLENVAAPNLDEFPDEKLSNYLDSLGSVYYKEPLPKYYYSPDVVSGLSYFLAKNIFGFKKSYGLNYFIITTSRQKYWFFDPEIKQFIGYISFGDPIDFDSIHTDSNVKQVDFVSIDKDLKGRGYGTKMYLTVLSGVDFLMSDSLLYNESLNIWVNILPKYAKVWGRTNWDERPFVPINKKGFVKPEFIKFYVASIKKNIKDF
jgi:hypothetical protein